MTRCYFCPPCAPKEIQYSLFSDIRSVLNAVGNRRKVLLSPIPRFLNNSCCSDQDHIPNSRETYFKENLCNAIFECRRNLKDFCFRAGLRNIRTAGPLGPPLEHGESDNVHLTPAGYDAVASLVMSVSKEMIAKNMMAVEVNTSKRPREDQD